MSARAGRVAAALEEGDRSLGRAATAVRDAFRVDRASVARIDAAAGTFEIVAEAGAPLLSAGTVLPLETCSYFVGAPEGRAFGVGDFDRSLAFRRPLDAVIIAAGYHAGCSVPLHHEGRPVGALSLSAAHAGEEIPDLLGELEAVADVLASRLGDAIAPPAAAVLVCSADPDAAAGLARLIGAERSATAVLVRTAREAAAAAAAAPPEVVVCDNRPEGPAVGEVARALRRAGVRAPLVVVSSSDTHEDRCAALRAVRVARHLRGSTAPADDPHLTSRELQLLELLDAGLRFKQIARRLGVSEATAKTHGRNLFRKLDASSRAEAVHLARERGLLA